MRNDRGDALISEVNVAYRPFVLIVNNIPHKIIWKAVSYIPFVRTYYIIAIHSWYCLRSFCFSQGIRNLLQLKLCTYLCGRKIQWKPRKLPGEPQLIVNHIWTSLEWKGCMKPLSSWERRLASIHSPTLILICCSQLLWSTALHEQFCVRSKNPCTTMVRW